MAQAIIYLHMSRLYAVSLAAFLLLDFAFPFYWQFTCSRCQTVNSHLTRDIHTFPSLCIKHPSVAASHGKQFSLHFPCPFSKLWLSNRFTCDLHKLSASFEAADDDDADVVVPALWSCSCPGPRGHFLGSPPPLKELPPEELPFQMNLNL